MKTRTVEVRNPPSFVVVTGPDGERRWLNAHRILSMREDGRGTWVEMDNGDAFQVEERAAVIAEAIQQPTVTIVATPTEG